MKGTTQRNRLILEVLVVLSVVLMLVRPVTGDSYRRFATDTLHYVRATVEEVIAQELTDSPLNTGQKLGSQHLLVRLSDGQEVELPDGDPQHPAPGRGDRHRLRGRPGECSALLHHLQL